MNKQQLINALKTYKGKYYKLVEDKDNAENAKSIEYIRGLIRGMYNAAVILGIDLPLNLNVE